MALASCEAAMVMETEMYLEQGLMVVEMDDMAGDICTICEEHKMIQ